VLLETFVDQVGNPTQIAVVIPLGYGLDEEAIRTVSRWKFGELLDRNDRSLLPRSILKRTQRRVVGCPLKLCVPILLKASEHEIYFDLDEHLDRLAIFRRWADEKHPPGLYLYGKVMQSGYGGSQRSREGARALYTESAAQKFGPAIYELAVMHLAGDHFPKELEAGMILMRDAAGWGTRRRSLSWAMRMNTAKAALPIWIGLANISACVWLLV